MDGTPRAMAAAARFARFHASRDTAACRPSSCLKMSLIAAQRTLVAGRLRMAATLPLSAVILRLSRLVTVAECGLRGRVASRRPQRPKFCLEKGSCHRRREVRPTGESAASTKLATRSPTRSRSLALKEPTSRPNTESEKKNEEKFSFSKGPHETRVIFVQPGIGPFLRFFASTLQNFQVFACFLTVSQRPHIICNSCTLLRPQLWGYPFTPYLYFFFFFC